MPKSHPAKPTVKDLPAHAQLEFVKDTWYVYFAYTFSIKGKRGQERDYLGVVDPQTHEFIPNAFYMRERPTFENRNPDRWKNPEMKERALLKLKETTGSYETSELDEKGDYSYQVGATALAMALLEWDGLPYDLGNSIFKGNLRRTMDFLNLAMHVAITADPTYLAKEDSEVQKYIGTGCLDSERASEFLREIGSDTDAPYRLAKARVARINPEDILALDATRFDSDSDQISISEIGKNKDGGYSEQISYTLLISARSGQALCYRLNAGNVSDISTIEDLVAFCNEIGLKAKNPLMAMDRGYSSGRNLVEMDCAGILFIAGVKNSLKVVRDTVETCNSDYYQIESVLPDYGLYAVQSKATFTHDGKSVDLSLFTYRNPVEETRLAMETVRSLQGFEEEWSHGFYDIIDKPLAKYYIDPKPGKPLKRNTWKIQSDKLTDGFFAFVSNVPGLDKERAFRIYTTRNEVEVSFRLIFHYLMHSTKVHSLRALQGLMMVTFAAIGILAVLRAKMELPMLPRTERHPSLRVKDRYTISQVFKQLSHIALEKRGGQCRLINVTQPDHDLVSSLGFKNLFSDARAVDHLLSASYLAQILKGHSEG